MNRMNTVRIIVAHGLLALACATNANENAQYYDVPKGAGPHDVAADPRPGGPVYYTAQRTGKLGVLDPASGKVEEIPLGRGSAPHGVIVGADGAAWVTDGGQNAIVRVEPGTHAVKTFPLPKGFEDANLNTATFDRIGVLWFTGQNGIYGRLDPASGKVDAWKAPKGVGPYGITTTPNGEVWYASLAGDHIARIDTVSGEATMVAPPKPRAGPRRIWSDSKGLLWVSFWTSGELGRYDPQKKSWSVWPMPKSKEGCYAVFVDDKDQVWVSDWGANAIHRFDPATQQFASFPSNQARSDVRQILGRPGELWAAESGTERLVVIKP
jgi:virginiamycin B lyase